MDKQHLSELDYYFKTYWNTYGKNNSIYSIKIPETESDLDKIPTNSIFALLFNNGYYEEDYVYAFKSLETGKDYFSRPIIDRLFYNSDHIVSYLSDSSGAYTIVDINSELIVMLDYLLEYRLYGVASISFNVLEYDSLVSDLSKLIFIYLKVMIDSDYSRIESEIPISESSDLVNNLFEVYVVNETYRKASIESQIIGDTVLETRPGRTKVQVDSAMLRSKSFETDEQAYSTADFYLFRNGDLKDRNLYDVYDGTNSTVISWDGYGLESEIEDKDVLIADYYVEVGQV